MHPSVMRQLPAAFEHFNEMHLHSSLEDEISSVIQAMPSCKALQKSTGTIDVKIT
jgi:hypothetical protein